MDYVHQALRGLLIGVLIALIVFYVLRPHEPYPKWVLTPFDQPWMLIVLVAVIVLVFLWDQRIALLIVIFVIGVGMDVNVYGKTYVHSNATESEYPVSLESGVEDVTEQGIRSFPGDPLQRIELPNYPLMTQLYTEEPGSPAPF